MNYCSRSLRFARKPLLRGSAGRVMRCEDLERHMAIQLRIEPLQDDPHPAASDHLQNVIVVQPPQGQVAGRRIEESPHELNRLDRRF